MNEEKTGLRLQQTEYIPVVICVTDESHFTIALETDQIWID